MKLTVFNGSPRGKGSSTRVLLEHFLHGFMTAGGNTNVEKYLEKLASRLGCRYVGTVIKGGCEGIRTRPARRTRKLFESFYQLGQVYLKLRR